MRNVVLASVAAVALLGWQAHAVAAQGKTRASASKQAGTTESSSTKSAKTEAAKKASVDPDQAFVKRAADGGMLEVELGRMAANQASSDDVKKFGQRMVDDHSKANNDLSALAQKKNITLPASETKTDKSVQDHLSKLNGAAFDKAYMQHMVTDHTKDVREFEHESKMGKDADVKAWAGQVLPTLEDHLKQAKQVSSSLTTGAAEKSGKASKKK